MVSWLGAKVVEVDHVGHGVHQREEERGEGADLVELEVGVEGDVLVQGHRLQLRDQVLGHRQQQQAVAEGEGAGRAPGDGDAQAHDLPQVRVLGHEGEVWSMRS